MHSNTMSANTTATAAVLDSIERTAKTLCAALTGRDADASQEARDAQSDIEVSLVYDLADQVCALDALVMQDDVFGPVHHRES